MPYLGERKWNPGTTETLRRIMAGTWVKAADAFTYPGHGGSREDASRCIDCWTGTSAGGRKKGNELVSWLLPRMAELNIWYIVWNERIYSRTYPNLIKGVGSGKHYNAKSNSASDKHTNHVHISCYAGAPKPGGKPTEPEKPTYLGPYYVDPAKVSSWLWGVRDKDDVPIKKRGPGHELATGVQIVERKGHDWLLTEAGYRYSMDYLTLTKPPAA